VTFEIAPLRPDEVESLCALACIIWRDHYPPIIGTAQTEYMLAQRYDPDIVRAELERDDLWWDVARDNGAMVGFASSFVLEPRRTMKIDKLYVDSARQRTGYGGALLRHVCERASRLGFSNVVLAVNRHNASAIGAYRKHGFTIAESVVKDIGGGFVMDDYIMERKVEGGRQETTQAGEAGGGRREV
jgi:ribosomal protein S18 acetylase RimI-like enzyme